jgi:NAD(P)-dependent dehydrogenase (short-subunit alcohol dehydrogenase family)
MEQFRFSRASIAVIAVVATFLCLPQARAEDEGHSATTEAPTAQKAVLVTGASSGIGRKITEVLASRGVYVYAGARKAEDLKALDTLENVTSIRLDVTIQSEIDAAVETVRVAGRGLYGLVNNAGVAILAPLIEVEESELDFLFDVNIYGPYRVTKAFAPLLIESRGRITTISSISGILSGTFFGPYSMSKHAMEAYGDSLAREMRRFDVRVSLVEPGNYKSDIGLSLLKRLRAGGTDFTDSAYREDLERIVSRVGQREDQAEPDAVAEAVFHALFDDNPKMRYMVVPNQEEAMWTIKKAIQETVQLNQGHPFSYDREQLIEMLDEALAASRDAGHSD